MPDIAELHVRRLNIYPMVLNFRAAKMIDRFIRKLHFVIKRNWTKNKRHKDDNLFEIPKV